jgi:hypothetical protein
VLQTFTKICPENTKFGQYLANIFETLHEALKMSVCYIDTQPAKLVHFLKEKTGNREVQSHFPQFFLISNLKNTIQYNFMHHNNLTAICQQSDLVAETQGSILKDA